MRQEYIFYLLRLAILIDGKIVVVGEKQLKIYFPKGYLGQNDEEREIAISKMKADSMNQANEYISNFQKLSNIRLCHFRIENGDNVKIIGTF